MNRVVLTGILSIVALCVGFEANSFADDKEDFKLICGTWTRGKNFSVTYDKDGTFKNVYGVKGTWKIDKGMMTTETVTVVVTPGDKGGKRLVFVETYRVTKTRLVLTRKDGDKIYKEEYLKQE